MAKPRGPHGGSGDGGHTTEGGGHPGEGGEPGEGGVPRQRGGQHGAPTSVNGIHEAVADAQAAGRPGGAGTGDGRKSESEGETSETPQNDPELDKKDPRTLAEIAKARKAVEDRLRQMSDEAWDHVDNNRDQIFQQPGYQRMREDLVQRYGEDTANRMMDQMVLGTEAHSHLANAVTNEARSMLDPSTGFRLRSEVNFDSQGVEVSSAPKDGFRPDVILERQAKNPVTEGLDWEVAHAYDLKTGVKTGIEPGWSRKVTEALKLPSPPEELRPSRRPLE